MLSAEFQPPPDFRPETYADLPPPPPDELFYEEQPIYAFDDFGPPPPPPPVEYVYVEDDDWRDLPPPPPPAYIGALQVLEFAIPASPVSGNRPPRRPRCQRTSNRLRPLSRSLPVPLLPPTPPS
jgi:hypothetical protein